MTALTPPGLNIASSPSVAHDVVDPSEATQLSSEAKMAAFMKAGDFPAALQALAHADRVNTRMLNMGFTAKIETGCNETSSR